MGYNNRCWFGAVCGDFCDRTLFYFWGEFVFFWHS